MVNAGPRNAPSVSACVALAGLALAFGAPGALASLAYDRHAILAGEIWRLWSAHLVHFSVEHALCDLVVLFLLAAMAEREIGWRRLGIGLVLGAPLISLGLMLAAPALSHYRGASGIALAMAPVAGAALWRTRPSHRGLLLLLAAGLLIKTTCEAFGVSADLAHLPPGVLVAWQAHAFGAIWGFLMVLMVCSPSRSRMQRNSPICSPPPCV